jgi:hypothetical protein
VPDIMDHVPCACGAGGWRAANIACTVAQTVPCMSQACLPDSHRLHNVPAFAACRAAKVVRSCVTLLLRCQLRVELEDEEEVARLRAVARYATAAPGGAPFPPPPKHVGPFRGILLEDWLDRKSDVVAVP